MGGSVGEAEGGRPRTGLQLPHRSLWLGDSGAEGGGGAGCAGLWVNRPGIQYGA